MMRQITSPEEKSRLTDIVGGMIDYFTFRSIRDKKKLLDLFREEQGFDHSSLRFNVYGQGAIRAAGLLGIVVAAGTYYIDPEVGTLLKQIGLMSPFFAVDFMVSKLENLDEVTERLHRFAQEYEREYARQYRQKFRHGPYQSTSVGGGSGETVIEKGYRYSVEQAREILNVSKDVSDHQVKTAYRRLALKYHPDIKPGNLKSERIFRDAAEAYSVLNPPKNNGRKV